LSALPDTLPPVERRIDVGGLLPGEGTLAVAADVFLPSRLRSPPAALFCLPGGAMNRRYFDLRAEGAVGEFSFAAHMSSRGFIVVALDPLGVGGSSRPRDGFELTPDVLTAANALAVDALRSELLAGRLTGEPLQQLQTIGVGHSMGAMLTAMQQAHQPQHAALMLFGFGTQGLPSALSPEEQSFAGDPAGARGNVVRLARARSPEPYPQIGRSAQAKELFAGDSADRRGVEALQSARAGLLVTAGLFSMIPGSSVPECAQVETPVLLAVGERDIAGPPHQIPASFPASRDVTLLVLPATGHCHFLFDSRRRLFERAAAWCDAILAER
jgi:pimeloyl-ACP methyl ester carboxylesterase